MREIYQKASVTIIASSADSSSHGFLEKRTLQPSDHPLFSWRYHCPNSQLSSIYFSADNGYNPREKPVRKQAWTLQERLLSPHILDYGNRQMRWACKRVRRADGGFRNPIPSGAEATELLKSKYAIRLGLNDENLSDVAKSNEF
jgi:hypothetical protein